MTFRPPMVADTLGEDVAMVFKTLVLHGDRTGGGGYFVCVIPGAEEVDLKKAAKAAGMKKAEMIPMKELLPLTGYIRGGCTAIGMKKPFPVYFHTTATSFDRILSARDSADSSSNYPPPTLSVM